MPTNVLKVEETSGTLGKFWVNDWKNGIIGIGIRMAILYSILCDL